MTNLSQDRAGIVEQVNHMREATVNAYDAGELERASEYYAAGRLFMYALLAMDEGNFPLMKQAADEAAVVASLADLMMVS